MTATILRLRLTRHQYKIYDMHNAWTVEYLTCVHVCVCVCVCTRALTEPSQRCARDSIKGPGTDSMHDRCGVDLMSCDAVLTDEPVRLLLYVAGHLKRSLVCSLWCVKYCCDVRHHAPSLQTLQNAALISVHEFAALHQNLDCLTYGKIRVPHCDKLLLYLASVAATADHNAAPQLILYAIDFLS